MDAPSPPLIDRLFLGIGAMKAGTTWAYDMLRRHPGIYFSYEKEIHYFYARHVDPGVLSDGARLAKADERYLRFDPARADPRALRDRLRWTANYLDSPIDDHWYRGLFLARRVPAWAADFSNLYALLPAEAWTRIAGQVGSLRVLYTLRDPVDRLWSHLKFHLEVTGRREELTRWSAAEMHDFLRQPFLWDHAEYGAALRRLRAGLPPGLLHVAWHEDARHDPLGYLRGVEAHLGLAPHDWAEDLLTRRVNEGLPDPVPEALRARLAPDARRIIAELSDLGLTPPAAWEASAAA